MNTMRTARNYAVVLVTAPDRKTARRLAGRILEERLAACVNLVAQIESHYWWQGRLESGQEVLLILKTTRTKLAALEKCVLKYHPYNTPECVALPLHSGSEGYLRWITQSLLFFGPARRARKKGSQIF